MIKPSVGRVVWFTPAKGDSRFDGYSAPFAAHVAYGDRMVNLMVITPTGGSLAETSVTLLQAGDVPPDWGRYCEWMPYQKGQAAKTDVLELAAAARAAGSSSY